MKAKRYMCCFYDGRIQYSTSKIWFTAGMYIYNYDYNKTGGPEIKLVPKLHLLAIL